VGSFWYAANFTSSDIEYHSITLLTGSKLLDPFGIFGISFSKSMQERMVSRYGYIPNSSDMDYSGARNLGLFLSDFLVNVGPLGKRDDDKLNEEESIMQDRYAEGDGFEYDASGMEIIGMVRR
jgi:hypothetical protein